MKHIRLVLRLFFFALVLLWYFFTAIIILALFGFRFDRARNTLTHLIALTCKLGLKIFNIKVHTEGMSDFSRKEGILIVSNHLSYIDIFAISSLFPTSFVTSHEMRKKPFLGHLCEFGGCLFVDRLNRRQLAKEVEQLSDALMKKGTVTIFPESTSTNGEKVHAFRKPLFQSAINARVPVLPLVLNYESLDGKALSLENHASVFWYGDYPFFAHALRLFSHRELVVRVKVLPEIYPTHEDKYTLAEKAHKIISDHYRPVVN